MNTNKNNAIVNEVIAGLAHKPGALMPILTGIHDRLGYVPPETVPAIAKALNQTRAEVHGTISFYHDFRTTPPGKHTLQICRAESCQAMAGRELEATARDILDIEFGETSADGQVSLEPVYCLGNCACSPSVRIDDEIHGRVSSEKLQQMIKVLRDTASEIEASGG